MANRIGITTDFETRKWELERDFKNTRNWKHTQPFADKKEAQDWEKAKAAELSCKTVPQDTRTKNIRPVWVGFYFEHDGPKK